MDETGVQIVARMVESVINTAIAELAKPEDAPSFAAITVSKLQATPPSSPSPWACGPPHV